jgi:3,5-epimerase/4-reductase
MKELILGNGFIGKRMHKEFDCLVCTKHISILHDVINIIREYKPKVIINCIGYTGRNVDDCETHKDLTLWANTFVPTMLAEGCAAEGVKLVHLSSGCIYDQEYHPTAITEADRPDFFNLFYSRTKIYAEEIVKFYPCNLIVRPRVPLDCIPHPRNILTKLLTFDRVIDTPQSVTYLPDFFKAVRHLIDMGASGIYNVVNKGELRYPQLLDIYGADYHWIPRNELGLVRTDLILSVGKLERTGFKMPYIHERLEDCVKEYKKWI